MLIQAAINGCFTDKAELSHEDFKPQIMQLMGIPSYFSVLIMEKLGKTPKDKINQQ
jgi:hypothetical protein